MFVLGIAGLVGLAMLSGNRTRSKAPKTTAPKAFTAAERDQVLGPLQWENTDNGQIRITNNFKSDKLVTAEIPQLKRTVTIHQDAEKSLVKIFEDIEAAGLLPNVQTFGGVFAERQNTAKPGEPSAHAYGAAIDINSDTNPVGVEATKAQRELVPYFEKWGWVWGGVFGDPGHFELGVA